MAELMNDKLLLSLAQKIEDNIRKNFETVHLSGNLMNTINITMSETGFAVEIPAEMYDIEKYLNEKVIVYTGEGSYAQKVNISGGISGKHINYVEYAITDAIYEWIKENNLNGRITEIL